MFIVIDFIHLLVLRVLRLYSTLPVSLNIRNGLQFPFNFLMILAVVCITWNIQSLTHTVFLFFLLFQWFNHIKLLDLLIFILFLFEFFNNIIIVFCIFTVSDWSSWIYCIHSSCSWNILFLLYLLDTVFTIYFLHCGQLFYFFSFDTGYYAFLLIFII